MLRPPYLLRNSVMMGKMGGRWDHKTDCQGPMKGYVMSLVGMPCSVYRRSRGSMKTVLGTWGFRGILQILPLHNAR
jgi:hypothetical protein